MFITVFLWWWHGAAGSGLFSVSASASYQLLWIEGISLFCWKCLGKSYKQPIVAGFGNPLLDVYVVTKDDRLLDKYKLPVNGQMEMEREQFACLFKEVIDIYEVKRYPGGCAQNTLRLFQWLVASPSCSVIFGGIGIDENGKLVKSSVEDAGVQTRYAYHEGYPTGMCISLVNGDNRSLIAHIGAANVYRPNDFDIPENWEILKKVLVVYVEGYFITHDLLTAMKLVEFCNNRGTCFVFNLSAVYVCENFMSNVLEVLSHSDVIFGNQSEYFTLSKALNLNAKSISDVIHQIKELIKSKKCTKQKNKHLPQVLLQSSPMLVATNGKGSVLVYDENTWEFPVPQLDKKCVKDTTGAGDAFVAGFLAGTFANCDLEGCVKWGCWTAQQVIKEIGVGSSKQSPKGLVVPLC